METTTVWSLLEQAGPAMVPLYLCSLVALAVTFQKTAQFAVGRVGDRRPLDLLQDAEPLDTLPERLGERSPLARVLSVAARAAAADRTRAADAAARAAAGEVVRYDSFLALLSYVAQAAQLFGLLGTVLGMIDLFAGMQSSSHVANATLAAGIWKALLCTAAGLMIAIPTIGVHQWFSRRLDLLQHRMETGVSELLARYP